MIRQIKRSDFPDYASYLDAIAEPIGGAMNPAVWDEDEQEWVLNPEWVLEQERRGRRRRERPDPPPSLHSRLRPSLGNYLVGFGVSLQDHLGILNNSIEYCD